MDTQRDGTLGARRIEDAPISRPWQWLGLILIGPIICFGAVATVVAAVNGTLG